MASNELMGQLEEQPPAKKPRIDKTEEQGEIANSNESNLSETTEQKDEDSETSTKITLDLPLNCEVFKCLKLPIQKKFIWGLGRGIYGMFGQKLLKKTKRVRNPFGNRFNGANTRATVAADGLNVSNEVGSPNVFADKPFPIYGRQCRIDEFSGTILYYYEVKGRPSIVGLGDIIYNSLIDPHSNSYVIPIGHHHSDRCWLGRNYHRFELPVGAIRPKMKENGNVFGCGLVLDPKDKLWIFFTLNGQLLGRKIPINPTGYRLFPAVALWRHSSFEANFGDDPAKPFEYDIQNCPGLELACI